RPDPPRAHPRRGRGGRGRRVAAHRRAAGPQPDRRTAPGPAPGGGPVNADLLALLAAVALLGANAFFVGAEFALISARRDRLEAMAAEGTAAAGTVLRAHADLSRMLAASQLGITISSLLLGRLGEPAVAHLIERPTLWLGLPDALVPPLAFTISLAIVVVAHTLLGEMVPKNIAIAGPERTAILLVPPFLVFT